MAEKKVEKSHPRFVGAAVGGFFTAVSAVLGPLLPVNVEHSTAAALHNCAVEVGKVTVKLATADYINTNFPDCGRFSSSFDVIAADGKPLGSNNTDATQNLPNGVLEYTVPTPNQVTTENADAPLDDAIGYGVMVGGFALTLIGGSSYLAYRRVREDDELQAMLSAPEQSAA